MTKLIDFVKRHWLILILILVIFLLVKDRLPSNNYSSTRSVGTAGINLAPNSGFESLSVLPSRQIAPTDTANRLVIQDTSLSLVVKDVAESISKIKLGTESLGGFLVNSFLTQPESAASGNIIVRVPETKRAEALQLFKQFSTKVISQSESGTDVTDQYVDIQSRLDVLNQTKAKFQEIMAKAVTVADLMNVQQELINLQNQIDSLKGQQKYLDQSAKLTKITVYLSTDELSLPYAPTNEWRPLVIFKTAVRAMLETFRGIVGFFIWVIVYIPIIAPILGIIWFLRRRKII
ncbi:MAG: DUF4349 domain-containing protein [Candidatus Shapirobacteria bacterium]|nr:DUF4349 domain-containing protein [Candidatus Shapirobacteria bacterium]